ncbi:MAG: FHA domain-containing protein, partial [Xanthomonadales bacterium]|nr:FHA domain-containing protein [Xanthomonadales bacterium]
MSPVRVRLQFTDALGAGQSFEVADGDVCGRDASVNLLFDHPTVSRRHARFTIV